MRPSTPVAFRSKARIFIGRGIHYPKFLCRVVCLSLLMAVMSIPSLASPPSTPLRLEGQTTITGHGREVRVDAVLQCDHPLDEVMVSIEISRGDILSLLSPDSLAEATIDMGDEGGDLYHLQLSPEDGKGIIFQVEPGSLGDHDIRLTVHSLRDNGEIWGDRYSYFYHDDGRELTEGWRDFYLSQRTLAIRSDSANIADEDFSVKPATIHFPEDPIGVNAGQKGSVTVSGRWLMYDPSNMTIPMDGQIIQLCDGSTHAVLTESATGWDGSYSFAPVTNPGSLYVRIRAESYHNRSGGQDRLFVFSNRFSPETSVYYSDTPTYYSVPDGSYYIGNYWIPDADPKEKAYWSLRWMQDAWDYIYSVHGDGTTFAGSMKTCWPSVFGPGWQDTTNIIHLSTDDPASPDMTVHECGHNIMWNAYGSAMPTPYDCPSPHYFQRSGGPVCGWWEGWPSFLSMAVYDDPIFTWPDGINFLNLETPTWGTTNWDNGYTVEGRVTGALWDLIDSANEGNDFFTDPIVRIWETVWNVNNNNFCEFWDSTAAFGLKRNRDNALYQNTITECTTCIEDPWENDDLCAQALPEDVPSTYTYEHCTDEDWQYIDAQRDWLYVWETDEMGCGVYNSSGTLLDRADTTLTLYAADCVTQLGYNDDKSYGLWPYASRLEWTSDRNARVYIVARQWSGLYGAHQSYDITLTASCPNPVTPYNLNPSNGATVCTDSPSVTWSGSGRVFDVYVDDIVIVRCSGTTDYSCDLSGLSTGWHSWYIVARNDCDGSSVCTTQWFYVADYPTAMTTTAVDVAACIDSGVMLSWDSPSSWNDNGTGSRTFSIWKTDGTWIAFNLSENTTSFLDTSGPDNTSYEYYVMAENGCSMSQWYTPSNSEMDMVGIEPTWMSTVATDMDECSDTGVLISWPEPWFWGDYDHNIAGRAFRVLRNSVDISGLLPGSSSSFIDTTGVNNTTYDYVVRAINGCSLAEDYVFSSATDRVAYAPSVMATQAVDSDACFDTGVAISWPVPTIWGDNDVNSQDRGFHVLRNSTDISGLLDGSTTSFIDNTGNDNTTYTYVVQAVNGCSQTIDYTGQVASDKVADAPTIMSTSAVDAHAFLDTGVAINWVPPTDWGDNGVGSTARYFMVVRDGVPVTNWLSSSTLSHNDDSGDNNVTYTYHIRTRNGCDIVSDYSGQNAADVVMSPGEAASAGNMTALPGDGSEVLVTGEVGHCATDHAIYWGYASGALAGPSWTDVACERGMSGSFPFDPGTPPAGTFFYFVVVANNGTIEGSFGRDSQGLERQEAIALAGCDYTQDLTSPCTR